ncbi:MAG: c-type cytochrome [Sphingomonadaceae bacterium]|nr:c-type cytochrome [Sphingomonadaceae bacterium]
MNKTARVCAMAGVILTMSGCGGDAPDRKEAAVGEVPAAQEPAQTAAATQASASGAPPRAFMQCRTCHSAEPGRQGIGPSLHGIIGRNAASTAGFSFSPALKASGITWDRESLNTWLEAPVKMVPGTRMVMGVRNEERRSAILDYLETLD